MKSYDGPLRPKIMDTPSRKAYQVWCNQRERCRSHKHVSYKYYGGKGVTVKYGPREFIAWYVSQLESNNFKRPAVGRIDHGGHYEFGNIEMVEGSDNTREMIKRTGGNAVGTAVVLVFEDVTHAFCSASKAAKFLDMTHSSLLERMQRRPFSKKGKKPRKHNCEIMSLDKFLGDCDMDGCS